MRCITLSLALLSLAALAPSAAAQADNCAGSLVTLPGVGAYPFSPHWSPTPASTAGPTTAPWLPRPRSGTASSRAAPPPSPGDSATSPTDCDLAVRRRTWAELLERTFAEDVLQCPRCGDHRRRIATITDPLVARRILRHIGARYDPLPLAPARPPPQGVLTFE